VRASAIVRGFGVDRARGFGVDRARGFGDDRARGFGPVRRVRGRQADELGARAAKTVTRAETRRRG
jgi:hypothetical protein